MGEKSRGTFPRRCRRCRRLEAENRRLRDENRRLKTELSEARRAAKRQAGPFSKGPPKKNPKRPGRKRGHAPAHRRVPRHVDRVVRVPLADRENCSKCHGALEDHRLDVQYQEDLPPQIRPVVTKFEIESAWCACCRRRMRGKRDREQTSDAVAAAGVQIGPRAMSLAAELKHELGIPYRKVQTEDSRACLRTVPVRGRPGPGRPAPGQTRGSDLRGADRKGAPEPGRTGG
jgi:hypothetical protein